MVRRLRHSEHKRFYEGLGIKPPCIRVLVITFSSVVTPSSSSLFLGRLEDRFR